MLNKTSFRLEKDFFYPLVLTIFTILIICLSYLFFYSLLPQKLPLFYSYPWGESELALKPQFLILPVSLLLITLLNLLLASQLHPTQLVLKRVLIGTSYLIDLIILVTALKILFLFI